MLPLLLVATAATLALGIAFFAVGRASNLRTEAQSAADAAALAGARNLEQQLRSQAGLKLDQILGQGAGLDPADLEAAPACAAARDYAARNRARVLRCQRSGAQLRVAVETTDTIGKAPAGQSDRRGEAAAVAEVGYELLVELPLPVQPPGLGGSGPPGPPPFAGGVDDLFRFRVRLIE